jgi:hypothetical protein
MRHAWTLACGRHGHIYITAPPLLRNLRHLLTSVLFAKNWQWMLHNLHNWQSKKCRKFSVKLGDGCGKILR